ncbi:exported hypothetical protein [Xanthomonas phaseoli pv. phaseoli]|nr:exported hypothetical protein [Xanthomonas phaseoli pv. phaseoli]
MLARGPPVVLGPRTAGWACLVGVTAPAQAGEHGMDLIVRHAVDRVDGKIAVSRAPEVVLSHRICPEVPGRGRALPSAAAALLGSGQAPPIHALGAC